MDGGPAAAARRVRARRSLATTWRVWGMAPVAALVIIVAGFTSSAAARTLPDDVMPAVAVPGAPLPGDGPSAAGWQRLERLPCATRIKDTAVVKVTPDTALDQAWTTYADDAVGWTGGDSVHAYPLGPDQVLWTFADSFLGTIGPRGTRPPHSPLVHSLFVRQIGDRFSTITGGSPGQPVSLVRNSANTIYLSLGGLQAGGRLQEFVLSDHWAPTGVTPEPADTLLATYALPSLRRLSLRHLSHETSTILWGAAVIRIRDYTYVYGTTNLGYDKTLYVARVQGTDLARSWQYWDGTGWTPNPRAVAGIDRGVSPELSVTEVDGMVVLVTTPTKAPYSSFVEFDTACSPDGPFRTAAVVRATYYTGSVGTQFYGVNDVYVYDAADQPAFNRGRTWLISYDQNVLAFPEASKNVAIYRPGYLWVQLGARAGGRA